MPANRTLLIRDADLVVTLDDTRRELAGASLLVRGPQIEAIWPAGQQPPGLHADEVINARGLPPDRLLEREDPILRDTQRLIEAYDDPDRFSLLRVVDAPCSPFSVSPGLMRDSAALARSLGTRLHTHLAENDHDIAYSRARFNMTPTEYADSVGWLGDDVWHAHCVKLDAAEINRFAATGTGVAHCPSSKMRLASGIAPVRKLPDAGVLACRWVWAWTAAPATTAPIGWARPAWPCCWRGWASPSSPLAATVGGPSWARAPRWRWPPGVAPGCWAAATSATWRRAWRRLCAVRPAQHGPGQRRGA